MYNNKPIHTGGLDWTVLIICAIMALFGWLAIYSAVYSQEHRNIFDLSQNYGKQALYIGICFMLALGILLLDHKVFNAFAYFIYGLGIFLCIAVIFVGTETKGAKAWFAIGNFKFQPVELAKYGTALALAKYLSTYEVQFKKLKSKIISVLIFLVPMVLVLKQNDTGSALVFAAFVLVLYREGLSSLFLIGGLYLLLLFIAALLVETTLLFIILIILAAIALVLFIKQRKAIMLIVSLAIFSAVAIYSVDYIFNNVLQEHQRARINVLFGKEGDDWNIKQSMIAIGSGGFVGKGFKQGTQTKYNFVPEKSTDFIFSTIGEEYGFLGAAGVVILFTVLLIKIVVIAERQKNKFSRLYAYAVAGIIFIHFLVNIGMTIGLMPVIGIPLPFFSYGGSSLIGFTLLVFTLLRLDANRVNEIQSVLS